MPNFNDHLLADAVNEVNLRNYQKTLRLTYDDWRQFANWFDRSSQKLPQNTVVIRTLGNSGMSLSPYQPFIDIIRQLSDDAPFDDLLNRASVYPLHRPLFQATFNETTYRREEPVILEELGYEKHRLRQGIIHCLSELASDKTLVIAIPEFNLASISSLKLLSLVSRIQQRGRVLYLIGYRNDCQFTNEEHGEKWQSFVNQLEGAVLNDESTELTSEAQSHWFDVVKNAQDQQVSVPADILRKAKDSLEWLANEEALLLAEGYLAGAEQALSEDFTLLKAEALYYAREFEKALIVYQSLVDDAHGTRDTQLLTRGYRKIALCYLHLQEFNGARRYIQMSSRIAKRFDQKKSATTALFALFLICEQQTQVLKLEQFEELLSSLESLGWENCYAFCSKSSFSYQNFFDDFETVKSLCEKAISISKKLDNEHALAAAYHKLGLYYASLQEYGSGLRYFKESEKLRLRIGHPVEIARICNGIGFFHLLYEDYEQALQYYQRSNKQLKFVRDYNEVAVSLFNLGLLYLHARRFKECLRIMTGIAQLMNILHIDVFPYHTIDDVYALKALCYLLIDQHVAAISYINRLGHMDEGNNPETQMFFYITRGILSVKQGNSELALEYFEQAKKLLTIRNPLILLFSPFFFIEYGRALYSLECVDEARAAWNEGLDIATENDFTHSIRWIQSLLASPERPIRNYPLASAEIDMDGFIDSVRKDVALNASHRKLATIKLLQNMQSTIVHSADKYKLANELLELMQMNYPIEVGVFAEFTGGEWQCLSARPDTDATRELFMPAVKALVKKKELAVVPASDVPSLPKPQGTSSNTIINLPLVGEQGVMANVLLVTERDEWSISSDDLDVLVIAAKQAGAVLEKIERSEALQRANNELNKTMEILRVTQNELVESEKMASLGQLVAGVAHEINTPVGVGVTAASHLEAKTRDMLRLFESGQLKKSSLTEFLATCTESSKIILSNLDRASKLIKNFKQVAVDQSSEERRKFNLLDYLQDVLLSLRPKLKNTNVEVAIDGDRTVIMDNYPGALSQIVSNLVINSLVHAFEGIEAPKILMTVSMEQETIIFTYKDNGTGISEEARTKIFTPFYTTKRGEGGTGLGLHIVYNLVTQKLKGSIACASEVNNGVEFVLRLPLELPRV
ncbi:MAG: hypothetical protein CMF25_07275 [Kangiellaceae bacterium]|nr:hypothetical protein [Kangiellaceae bacterium]|tara:strand:- start:147 stop:3584 length:3438 start_codon:yes stop_codon:yes gene_type:complete